MLHEFLTQNRDEIVSRARVRVAKRMAPLPTDMELTNGIPVFLEQLGEALRFAMSSTETHHEAIEASARKHGLDLFAMGLSVGQVVHDYGDVCQIVTELVVEQNAAITPTEFRTLNLCLDDAIAGAVTAHADQHEHKMAEEETERLGVFSHELRNHINVALLSFEGIKGGFVPAAGSTGGMHARSLMRIRGLIDRSLAEVRLDSGIERLECIPVNQLIEEVEIGATIEARAKSIRLELRPTNPALVIEGDPHILASALANLLQNAIKFTPMRGKVTLTVQSTKERVTVDVEDECGGLPPGKADGLFKPFEQRNSDRSGLGLGLFIAAKAAKVSGGRIRVQNLPGKGCVFTLDLPRKQAAIADV